MEMEESISHYSKHWVEEPTQTWLDGSEEGENRYLHQDTGGQKGLPGIGEL